MKAHIRQAPAGRPQAAAHFASRAVTAPQQELINGSAAMQGATARQQTIQAQLGPVAQLGRKNNNPTGQSLHVDLKKKKHGKKANKQSLLQQAVRAQNLPGAVKTSKKKPAAKRKAPTPGPVVQRPVPVVQPPRQDRPASPETVQSIITGDMSTAATHLKGGPRSKSRGRVKTLRSQSSPEVIARAQRLISQDKRRYHKGNTTNNTDNIYEVPRQNPRSTKAPRRFHHHTGRGDGKTTGFFEVPNAERGPDQDGQFSDSEAE